MNAKLAELARRREFLTAQLAGQRDELAEVYQQIKRPVGWIKGAMALAQTFRAYSTTVMGLTALLFGSRSRKYVKWPLILASAWLILRALPRLKAKG